MQKVLAVTLLALLVACSTGTEATDATQSQPPVIVVQAPPGGADAGAVGYEALASRVAPAAGAAAGAAADTNTPGSEPYEVVALLREFEPDLTDPPKDQASEAAYDDLLSALAVMDEKFLYGRMVMRAPMGAEGEVREARFWLEQGGNMVTVEVKVGSQNRPCELSDAKSAEAQKVVSDCFWVGNALDFRVPLESIPATIDTKEPYWVSGFQTCCSDADRNKPYDEIEGAHEVWRVTGLAAEVEVAPGATEPTAAAGGTTTDTAAGDTAAAGAAPAPQ